MLVEQINNKEWQGKTFAELTLDGKVYSCWQQTILATLKQGDTVLGEIVDKGAGKTPQIKITTVNGVVASTQHFGGGKGAPSKNESFAAAYSKDLAVACINKGAISSSAEIDAMLNHYFDLFMNKLK